MILLLFTRAPTTGSILNVFKKKDGIFSVRVITAVKSSPIKTVDSRYRDIKKFIDLLSCCPKSLERNNLSACAGIKGASRHGD
jgi:hypothetical protein